MKAYSNSTVFFDVLAGLSARPLSEQTVEQFNSDGIKFYLKS